MKHETLCWGSDQGIQTLSISRCTKSDSTKNLEIIKYTLESKILSTKHSIILDSVLIFLDQTFQHCMSPNTGKRKKQTNLGIPTRKK